MLTWLVQLLRSVLLFCTVLVLGGYLALREFLRGVGKIVLALAILASAPVAALGFFLHALYWLCRGRSVLGTLATLRELEAEWKEKKRMDEARDALLRAATLLGMRLSGHFPEAPHEPDDHEEEECGEGDESSRAPPPAGRGRRDSRGVPVDDSRIVKFRGKKRGRPRSPTNGPEGAPQRGSRPRG